MRGVGQAPSDLQQQIRSLEQQLQARSEDFVQAQKTGQEAQSRVQQLTQELQQERQQRQSTAAQATPSQLVIGEQPSTFELARLASERLQRSAASHRADVERELTAAWQSREQLAQQLRSCEHKLHLAQGQSQAQLAAQKKEAEQREQRIQAAAQQVQQQQQERLVSVKLEKLDAQAQQAAASQLKRKAEDQLREESKKHRATTAHVAQLEAEKDALQFECCVCHDARPSVLYLPCKHLAVCDGCDDGLEESEQLCPMCRREINSRHKGLHT